jgi:asparagine synthase (glutamine-hydrolysing)
MCGVLGIVALDGSHCEVDRPSFKAALDRLAHRGPDGYGILYGNGYAFGHRRLSIIGRSERGAQPMSAPEAAVHITYNGEIFNHEELRAELGRRGHIFTSSCDTEVLLRAYVEWGPACLDRLEGMFAFGIFDGRRRRLLLARDRLGIKPLFWARLPDALIFASELDALVSYPGVARSFDAKGVSAFLSFRHTVTARTCFAGVQQILPGHQLMLKSGEVRVERWWRLPESPRRRGLAPLRRRQLSRRMSEAVRRTLVADVPVATFLSGGLDSSVVLREAAALAPPPDAFTASFKDRGFDESEVAAEVAAAVGARHTVVPIEPGSLLGHLRELIRVRGQPLAMHNEVAVFLLGRATARTHKAVLSGEGADELFAGYGRLFRIPFDQRRSWLARTLPPILGRRIAAASGPVGGCVFATFAERYPYFPQAEKEGLFNAKMRQAADRDREALNALRESYECGARDSPHLGLKRVLLEHHLPGLLQMMDSMCMASGLEVRVPFVDHRLVEFAFRLPARWSLRWRSPLSLLRALGEPAAELSERRDRTKWALRRAYRSKLPRRVLGRRKNGFSVPLTEWLTTSLEGEVRRVILAPDARLHKLIDVGRLRDWLDAGAVGDASFGKKVWLLLNLELWLQEYFPEGEIVRSGERFS